MKTPPQRSTKTRILARRLMDWYNWLHTELECGMLDLGLFVRGERRVVTAEMILVLLTQLILMTVIILALVLWGVLLRHWGIGQ